MTGARIARAAARYLGHAEHFAVTYGDGLTDADLGAEVAFHLSHDRLGTVLAVNQPSQFGRLDLQEEDVTGFAEKPASRHDWINGGFFLFRRGFLDYLSADENCVLERDPLSRLAANRQLKVFRWGGFWSCVDTVPDHQRAAGLWEAGSAPWRA
jgi:glucose-1-phosphate cytidylyltransferase